MFSVHASPLPDSAALKQFAAVPGVHIDCYRADVSKDISLSDYAIAFFDSPVFRLERRLIALVGGKASRRADVEAFALGKSDTLSEWQVVERDADQILLAVGDGPIRTWIMRESPQDGTALYFGSAILPMHGASKIALGFRLLMGFHRLYARVLLFAAQRVSAR